MAVFIYILALNFILLIVPKNLEFSFETPIDFLKDDCIIKLNHGDIIYLPTKINYEVYFNARNNKIENILINFDIAENEGFLEIKKPIYVLNEITCNTYKHFNNILNSYHQKYRPFLINSYFYLSLDALKEKKHSKNDNKNSLLLNRLAKLLEENIKITVDTICDDIQISRSVFLKNLKNIFGFSSIEYHSKKE